MKKDNVSTHTISPQEAQKKIAAGARILNVREYPEWVACHISGAEMVPLGDLKSQPQRGAIADEVLTLCNAAMKAFGSKLYNVFCTCVKASTTRGSNWRPLWLLISSIASSTGQAFL